MSNRFHVRHWDYKSKYSMACPSRISWAIKEERPVHYKSNFVVISSICIWAKGSRIQKRGTHKAYKDSRMPREVFTEEGHFELDTEGGVGVQEVKRWLQGILCQLAQEEKSHRGVVASGKFRNCYLVTLHDCNIEWHRGYRWTWKSWIDHILKTSIHQAGNSYFL